MFNCTLFARSLVAALVVGGFTANAAATNVDDLLLKNLADPAFYQYPHRLEALADTLAVAETLLAVGGGYRDENVGAALLGGEGAAVLHSIADRGGRAGSIARVIMKEAELGYFGDAAASQRYGLLAVEKQIVEVVLAPQSTQRIEFTVPDRGMAMFSATCGLSLRPLPSGMANDGLPEALRANDMQMPEVALNGEALRFGVAPGTGCEGETTLFVSWLPRASVAPAKPAEEEAP